MSEEQKEILNLNTLSSKGPTKIGKEYEEVLDLVQVKQPVEDIKVKNQDRVEILELDSKRQMPLQMRLPKFGIYF